MKAPQDPRYAKRWRYDRARGITRLVDATPTVEHLKALFALGVSLRGAAAAAGVTPTVLSRLMHGQTKVNRVTERKVLAVTFESILNRENPDGFVPAIGARRRIRALLRMGWRHEDLSAAGVARSAVLLHQRGGWITRASHDAVAAAFERLCMTPGPSARTAGRAAKLGYAPPLAWDDIDDPRLHPELGDSLEEEFVDESAVQRALAGDRVQLTEAERTEAVRRLTARGRSDEEIAARLHLSSRTILRIRKEYAIASVRTA